jgi:alpha-galactosidase
LRSLVGSIVFCKTLILDIFATPGLQDTEFALMAPSTTRTSQVEAYVRRVIEANHLPAKVWVTTDRREALKGAKYVIATFQVGGVKGFEYDYKIPFNHGVDQCIGDTLGPGGIFRALRSIPVAVDMAEDMRNTAPAAAANYVNPMAMALGAGTTGVRGLLRRADYARSDFRLRGRAQSEIDYSARASPHGLVPAHRAQGPRSVSTAPSASSSQSTT